MKAVQSADEGKAKTVFLWILLLMVLAAVPVAMVVEGACACSNRPCWIYFITAHGSFWKKFVGIQRDKETKRKALLNRFTAAQKRTKPHFQIHHQLGTRCFSWAFLGTLFSVQLVS